MTKPKSFQTKGSKGFERFIWEVNKDQILKLKK